MPLNAFISACAAIAAAQGAAEPVDSTLTEDWIAARRAMIETPALRPISFRTARFTHYHETVERGKSSRPLKAADASLDGWTYNYDGEARGLRDYLARTYTNGFIVLHKGKVVTEAYRNGADPSSRFQVFSVSKSVTSLLLGAAIDDGLISGTDAQIVDYVPDLKGTAYEGVTIEHALQMRSGSGFREYDQGEDKPSQIGEFMEQVVQTNALRCFEFAGTFERAREPGAHFNYSTPETCVLAAVVENATKRTLSDYMSEKLWRPIGAEADAYWLLDGPPGVGRTNAGGGFNATARDLARLAQMVLDGGRVGKRQLISADWLEASVTPAYGEPVSSEEQWGYQYQWWTLVDSNAIAGHGVYGQFLYIDPDSDLVIVKLSYWPSGWSFPLEYETMAGFRAIADHLND